MRALTSLHCYQEVCGDGCERVLMFGWLGDMDASVGEISHEITRSRQHDSIERPGTRQSTMTLVAASVRVSNDFLVLYQYE